MKKWFLVPLFLLIAAALIFSSCGKEETTGEGVTIGGGGGGATTAVGETGGGAEPWGTITLATTDFGLEAMDQTLYESTWAWYFADSLITFNAEGQYVGEVAETFSISPDGNTWTFNIRHDIKFHNGDPLTANDVDFTITRFIGPDSQNPWAPGLRDNHVSHRVVDDYTFEFVTDHPEPPLMESFCWVRIMDKNYFESVGQEGWDAHPMGSGPWKFVEHIPETSCTFEANTEYWIPEHIPEYKYLVDIQVPEEATQVAMLKRGEIDIPLGLTTDKRVQLEKAGWETRQIGLPSPTSLNIVGAHFEQAGPVHDIRVRKALSFSIDREEMCATFYQGESVPGGRFFLAPGGFGAAEDIIAPDPYDPELAMSLLAEAGYPDAWDDPVIHCFTPVGPGLDMFQVLQGYWKKVGLQVQIEVVEGGTWIAYLFIPGGLTGDEINVGWIWAWTGAAFNSTYQARNMYTSYGVHQCLRLPEVDALYDAYSVELDPALSLQKYEAFQRAAAEYYTSFGLVYALPKFVVSPKIGEFTVNTHMYLQDAICGIKHPK